MRRWAPPVPSIASCPNCRFVRRQRALAGMLGACGKVDGPSIPQNYESFLQPISCARLWFDARRANTGLPAGPPAVGACIGAPPPDKARDASFVVKLHNCAPVGRAAGLPLRPPGLESLERYRAGVPCSGGLHGARPRGVPSSRLYDGVMILDQPGDVLDGHVLVVPLFLPFSRPGLRGRGVEACRCGSGGGARATASGTSGPSWGPTCCPCTTRAGGAARCGCSGN